MKTWQAGILVAVAAMVVLGLASAPTLRPSNPYPGRVSTLLSKVGWSLMRRGHWKAASRMLAGADRAEAAYLRAAVRKGELACVPFFLRPGRDPRLAFTIVRQSAETNHVKIVTAHPKEGTDEIDWYVAPEYLPFMTRLREDLGTASP